MVVEIVMDKSEGVIYILTNPSFPNYIKIGYAKDINTRLKKLNSSECTPYAFRVYALYGVDSCLSDQNLHSIIDKLNPDLRSVELYNGKQRKREFYAMSPEDAYQILEAMAEIHNTKDRLRRIPATIEEEQEEKNAREVDDIQKERASNFSFSKCRIAIGEQIEYGKNSNIKATVVSDNKVEFEGKTMTLTALAKLLTGQKHIAGPKYFKYKGKWLNDIRKK